MATSLYQEAKNALAHVVSAAFEKAVSAGVLTAVEDFAPAVEIPKDAANGDLSSPSALALAKPQRKAPKQIAQAILEHMEPHPYFSRYEVAGPGFINAFFSAEWYAEVLKTVEKMGPKYGSIKEGRNKTVLIEFVSANPTGPMHLGNARGGVLGDTLASVMEKAGYKVWREFYVNDAGNQVALLGQSLEARYIQHFKGEDAVEFPENGYHGADIIALAKAYAAEHGDALLSVPEEERRKALIAFGLAKNIAQMKADLARYKVEYDQWFLETSLHDSGYVAETMQLLEDRGMLYEKDGAKWLKGTELGMEKDEVLVKSNGFYTYYAVDIAYHRNKLEERGFDKAIDFLGADHHGHTVRFRAGLEALGIDGKRLEFVLYQLVNLMQNGEVVRMSKRTGNAITLSNLLDEISVDAARFFFNYRSCDSHLDFDLDLAVKQESDNPVYYVQYAHARICTMLAKLAEEGVLPSACENTDLSLLALPEEKDLVKKIALLPEEIRLAARDRDPSRMTRYLVELSAAFHSFYSAGRIRGEEPALQSARLKLAETTKNVLALVLDLLKISAPTQM
jgi:arginyl-tRNA synthetase